MIHLPLSNPPARAKCDRENAPMPEDSRGLASFVAGASCSRDRRLEAAATALTEERPRGDHAAESEEQGGVDCEAEIGRPEIAAVIAQGPRGPFDLLLFFGEFVEHAFHEGLPIVARADGGEIAAAEEHGVFSRA